jgi:hypothetical protein
VDNRQTNRKVNPHQWNSELGMNVPRIVLFCFGIIVCEVRLVRVVCWFAFDLIIDIDG